MHECAGLLDAGIADAGRDFSAEFAELHTERCLFLGYAVALVADVYESRTGGGCTRIDRRSCCGPHVEAGGGFLDAGGELGLLLDRIIEGAHQVGYFVLWLHRDRGAVAEV